MKQNMELQMGTGILQGGCRGFGLGVAQGLRGWNKSDYIRRVNFYTQKESRIIPYVGNDQTQ